MQLQLKKIRDAAGISQETIAALTDKSPGQISRIESGKSGWTDKFLARVSEALGVTPAEMVGGIAPGNEEEAELLKLWRSVTYERQGLFLRLIFALATALQIAPEEEYKHIEAMLRKAREDLAHARRIHGSVDFRAGDKLQRPHGVAGLAEKPAAGFRRRP